MQAAKKIHNYRPNALRVVFRASPKQSIALRYLQDDVTTDLFFGGGAGGAKTYLGCYWIIKMSLKYPKTRWLIGRNMLGDIYESTLITFREVCENLHLKEGYHWILNSQKHNIKFRNGTVILLRECRFVPRDPDFQRLGGMLYTGAFIDEAPEITERAYEVIQSRLRWKITEYKLTPKMLCTGNPGYTWVRSKFVKDKTGNMIALPTGVQRVLATLNDNPNKEFAANYRKQLEKLSEYDKARLLHGDWDAMPRTGKEFYHNFQNRHMESHRYERLEHLHMTWDFNLVPYITMLLFQIKQQEDGRYKVKGIGEFCQEHPANSIPMVAQSFKDDPELRKHNLKMFYYGDYNGLTGNNMGIENAEHYFAQIQTHFSDYLDNNSFRVQTNKLVSQRRDFMLDVLAGNTIIDLSFDHSMINTKNDFMYMKQGPDGLKLKERVMDPVTKKSYEKFGHTSDAVEYFLCSAFDFVFADYRRNENS